MALVNITEFQEMPQDLNGRVLPAASAPFLAEYDLASLSATPTDGAAFQDHTCFIRINPDVAIRYCVHPTDQPTATSTRLGAEAVEIIGVPVGKSYRISVRTA